MGRDADDDAQHLVVSIADGHFKDRAMTSPASNIGEPRARLHHAKRMALEDSFDGDEIGTIDLFTDRRGH